MTVAIPNKTREAIYEEVVRGKKTQRAVADEYGVCIDTVYKIVELFRRKEMGLHRETVKPYKCPGCLYRVEVKPCPICAARLRKAVEMRRHPDENDADDPLRIALRGESRRVFEAIQNGWSEETRAQRQVEKSDDLCLYHRVVSRKVFLA